jgi:hypothetical protein
VLQAEECSLDTPTSLKTSSTSKKKSYKSIIRQDHARFLAEAMTSGVPRQVFSDLDPAIKLNLIGSFHNIRYTHDHSSYYPYICRTNQRAGRRRRHCTIAYLRSVYSRADD